MKKLFSLLISLYLIVSILSACFKKDVSSVNDCQNAKSGSDFCCFVEYRTNLVSDYKKVCVPVKAEDVEDGRFEETIGIIESGNYTASNWTEEILQNFKEYASISTFDCKGNYISNVAILVSLIYIINLI